MMACLSISQVSRAKEVLHFTALGSPGYSAVEMTIFSSPPAEDQVASYVPQFPFCVPSIVRVAIIRDQIASVIPSFLNMHCIPFSVPGV